MNEEEKKALDRWITTPPEEPEEKEKPAVDFYGDVIKDDACVVVIDCNVFKMVDGKARYGWKTYDVLAANMDSFIEETITAWRSRQGRNGGSKNEPF